MISQDPKLPPGDFEKLDRALAASRDHLLGIFTPADASDRPLDTESRRTDTTDIELGYWVGELEADTTLESDYIIFLYFLDPEAHREKIRKLANFVKSKQLSDGSWNIYPGGPGEVSASVKAYFALKLAGTPISDPLMLRAREAILAMGGADRVNSFTKIYLSFLNQIDWEDCPAIPPEIVLLPRFFYFNIYEMSYWSRAIVVPLSILYARRPKREVPPEAHIDEIFTAKRGNGNRDGDRDNGQSAPGSMGPEFRDGSGNGGSSGDGGKVDADPRLGEVKTTSGNGDGQLGRRWPFALKIPRDPNLFSWRNFFLLVDRILKLLEKTPVKPFRNLALKTAEKWMVSRFERSDGLGAIFPAMVNSVIAMKCLGYDDTHPHVVNGIEKLKELEIEEGDTIRLQPCQSPVWDTALAVNALREAGVKEDHPLLVAAARWLVSKEARTSGDWQIRKPDLEASGWYFQFNNEFYPDVDDTAAVLMALSRTCLDTVDEGENALRRGIEWVLSMQCKDGGWAAFDVDVDHEILTQVPFADHNAMLDPACADITGRVLEMLGQLSSLRDQPAISRAIERGIEFLRKNQDESGAWFGRWGVNYIYGTWQVMKGLAAAGEDSDSPMIRRAVAWLESCQNADGGWGESCHSYEDPSTRGRGESTASQTAWAVMGLMAVGEVHGEAVRRGVAYLLERQNLDGTWSEDAFTGTGFPRVFYLKYHLYSQYFPLFALGHYRNALGGKPVVKVDRPIEPIELSDHPPAGEVQGEIAHTTGG